MKHIDPVPDVEGEVAVVSQKERVMDAASDESDLCQPERLRDENVREEVDSYGYKPGNDGCSNRLPAANE